MWGTIGYHRTLICGTIVDHRTLTVVDRTSFIQFDVILSFYLSITCGHGLNNTTASNVCQRITAAIRTLPASASNSSQLHI